MPLALAAKPAAQLWPLQPFSRSQAGHGFGAQLTRKVAGAGNETGAVWPSSP